MPASFTVAEDTNFVVGDSPVTIDVTDASRHNMGYLVCDGTGSILVEIAQRDTSYESQITVKANEVIDLIGEIESIRITHSGTDSSYRLVIGPKVS